MATTDASTASTQVVPVEHKEEQKLVPETILKGQKLIKDRLEKLKHARGKRKEFRQHIKKEAFTRAEQYIREYRRNQQEQIRFRRQAKQGGNFYVEPEAKLAFVIRIKGIWKVPPRPRKILQLLRLRRLHTGVFIKLNGASLQMLKLVEPYIAWGYPNLKSVREVITKEDLLVSVDNVFPSQTMF